MSDRKNTHPSFFHSWGAFLPPDAIVMGKRVAAGESLKEFSFIVQNHEALPQEESELLEKMILALVGDLARVQILSESSPLIHGKCIVNFNGASDSNGPAELGKIDFSRGAPYLETYSLRELVGNNELKKKVWMQLKELSETIGWSIPKK